MTALISKVGIIPNGHAHKRNSLNQPLDMVVSGDQLVF